MTTTTTTQHGKSLATGQDLAEFAADVKRVAAASPAKARVGERKVWIHLVWALGKFDCGLTEFKSDLIECNRLRLLDLSGADLFPAFDQHDLVRSRCSWYGATWNFVRI
jgi:hypothetical protein